MSSKAWAFTPFEIRAATHAVQKQRAAHVGWIGLVVCAVSLAACDRTGDARSEARVLVTHLNAVSDQGSLVERNAAIERLNKLRLQVEEHAQTREVCRTAHLGLLEAEAAQAEARKALNEAMARDSTALATAQSASIAANIERSNRALATAKLRFPECEKAMRKLVSEAH
jgi:hypothetical protein